MFSSLIFVFISLIAGYLIPVKNSKALNVAQHLSEKMIYLILLFMGMGLAQLDHLAENIVLISTYALTFFVLISSCNLVALFWFDRKFRLIKKQSREHMALLPMLTSSFKLIIIVVLGFLLGSFIKVNAYYIENLSHYSLLILLFVIGIQLRASAISLKKILLNKLGLSIAVVVLLSALLGGVIAAWLLGLPLIRGLIMASGFGWYSLAGVLITNTLDPIYGSAAFFNELLREMVAIILIPIFMDRFPAVAIGYSGATAMDFTLPIIQKAGGIQYVPVAVVSGFLLTLALPVLVVFFSFWL